MLRWHQIGFTRGFLLLLALFYYFDQEGILLWVTLAALVHELGHYGMIVVFGGKVRSITLSCIGAEMALSSRKPLLGWKLAVVTLAGPVANLVMALIIWILGDPLGEEGTLFWGLNVGLALFNLLPVAQLDGGRLLWQCTARISRSAMMEEFLWVLSLYICILLVVGGLFLWLLWDGSATLCITALWLLAAAWGRRWEVGKKYHKNIKIFLALWLFM